MIPVREICPFPSELLGSEGWSWRGSDHNDYVLIFIDTPPILRVTDELITATLCDMLQGVRIRVA